MTPKKKKQTFGDRLIESPITTILGCIVLIVAVLNLVLNYNEVLDLEWRQLMVECVLLGIGVMLYNAPDDFRLWFKKKLNDTKTPFKDRPGQEN